MINGQLSRTEHKKPLQKLCLKDIIKYTQLITIEPQLVKHIRRFRICLHNRRFIKLDSDSSIKQRGPRNMGGWKSGFKIKFLDNRGSIALVINKAMCKILQKYYKKESGNKKYTF